MKTNTKHDDRELTLETLEIGYHREFTSSTSVFLFVFVFVCFIFDSLANVSVHANSLWNPPLQKLLWDWTAKSISKAPGQLINGPVQISKGLSFLFDPGFVRKADFSPNELILNNFCCLLLVVWAKWREHELTKGLQPSLVLSVNSAERKKQQQGAKLSSMLDLWLCGCTSVLSRIVEGAVEL